MVALRAACLSAAFALDTVLRHASGQMLSDGHSVKLNGMREQAYQTADPAYLNSYNASGRQDRRTEAANNRRHTTESQDRINGWDQRGNDRYEVQVNNNFCYYLSQDEYDDSAGTCDVAAPDSSSETGGCQKLFHMGDDGNFTACTLNADDTTRCTDGETYRCPWTAHMLALERAQNKSTESCFGDILESKRSLDGLLKWVNETYMELLQETEIIRENNYTIYLAIEDQQRAEHSMIDCKIHCDNHAILVNETTLGSYEHQLHLLEDIADPEIRSKVNNRTGYYEGEAARRFDVAHEDAEEGWNDTKAEDQRRKANILVRDIPEGGSGFVQLDEAHLSDSVRSKKWSMMNLLGFGRDDEKDICHERRANLSRTILEGWAYYKTQYDQYNTAIQEGRMECHGLCENIYYQKIHGSCDLALPHFDYDAHGTDNNLSTWDAGTYSMGNIANESNPCVDTRISDAAGEISKAQEKIAVLEPRLHDLEHAVNRLRSHLRHQNQTCDLDTSVSDRLHQIHLIIKLISECPGRNDFVVTIPHWGVDSTPAPPVITPSPTPWFERDIEDIPDNMKGKYPTEAFEPVVPAGFLMESDVTEE